MLVLHNFHYIIIKYVIFNRLSSTGNNKLNDNDNDNLTATSIVSDKNHGSFKMENSHCSHKTKSILSTLDLIVLVLIRIIFLRLLLLLVHNNWWHQNPFFIQLRQIINDTNSLIIPQIIHYSVWYRSSALNKLKSQFDVVIASWTWIHLLISNNCYVTIWKLLNAKDFIAMFFVLLLSLLISFSSSCCHLVEEIAKIWFSTNYSLNNKQNLEYSAGDHEFIVFIATKSVWQFWHIQKLPFPCSIHNGWEIYSFESCHMKF